MVPPAPSRHGFVATDWRGPATEAATRAPPRHRAAADEFARATALIDRAKQVVRDQFDALRTGGGIDAPAVRRVAREVARSIRRNRYAVIGLTRLRSSHEYTYVHSVAVSALMIGVARELGLPEAEVDSLGLAGMLHDVGKSKVPIAVLDKPGPLSPAEWTTIKTHPERGAAILARFAGVDAVVLDVALHHHERMDGSGYPHGLAGEGISLHARIAAVCDVYDALTSKRAYKDSRPAAAVLAMMGSATGQFDAQVLRALRGLLGAFPAGTLVRLQRGQLALVADEVAPDPLCPPVDALWCTETRRALPPGRIDTRLNPILAVERPDAWPMLVA